MSSGRASERSERVAAVIVAAGSSQRMQGINKTWAMLGERPLLAHSVGVFAQSGLIDDLVVVLAKDALIEGERLREQEDWRARCAMTPGGARRRDSVLAGLEALAPAPDYVLIHDGARPFITSALIEQGLAAARKHGRRSRERHHQARRTRWPGAGNAGPRRALVHPDAPGLHL